MEPSSLKVSVGLEIHARLNTGHKLFCRCANQYGDEPNTNTCPVCRGLPGSLPVFNSAVVPLALRAALALNCNVPSASEFSRKNYFYPDLPRNFQITQYEHPLALGGFLKVDDLNINLQRIHLEEDAGRSINHGPGSTVVDLNRAGSPLIEIVTEPEFQNGDQVRGWLSRLRQLLKWLGVCDGKMETGSLRCDANVGFVGGHESAGPWVELKNLNSFKAVGLAVDVEIERLQNLIESGGLLQKETRSWNPRSRETTLLRIKEEASQYRYFPEPDLPLLKITSSIMAEIKKTLPEFPIQKEIRFQKNFGISSTNSIVFCRSEHLANYFEQCAKTLAILSGVGIHQAGHLVSGWILSHVLAAVEGNDENISGLNLNSEKLAEVLALLNSGKINKTRTRQLVEHISSQKYYGSLSNLVLELGVGDDQDISFLESICVEVLKENPQIAQDFRDGKAGLINFLVGQVIARSDGVLEAGKIHSTLLKMLN